MKENYKAAIDQEKILVKHITRDLCPEYTKNSENSNKKSRNPVKSEAILYDTVMGCTHIIYLSKPTECTTQRLNSSVNSGL